jgi:predicted anti-sigma-YlaC factor YlaD
MRQTMKCHSAQKKFSAYQDKELKPQEQEEISRHLLSCRSCREQYAKIERLWQTLGELEEIRPDPWFYRQIVRKIKEPRRQGLLSTLQHGFQLLRAPALVSIFLIIGLVGGIYLGSILTRFNLFPFQINPLSSSQEALFTSLKVFDPAPPGTLAEGYLRMVSYKENASK